MAATAARRYDDYTDPAEKFRRYETLRASLWSERQSGFDAHWRDLGDFLMPRRTRFWTSDRNRGDKRNQHIINSTGRFAARTLASGLHAGLTSPSRPWMKLTTHHASLAEKADVKAWLYLVSQRMLTMFETTNLYNVLPLVYMDMGCFATGVMSILDDTRDLFRCYSYPLGSYALGQDERGLVTTFVRDYELTVRQIVKSFGVQENGRDIDWSPISLSVKNQWDRGDYEQPVKLTWIVTPNEYADRKKLGAKFLPWSSCHFEAGGPERKFLRESGFETFPIMAPRWDITGEDTYGTDCPGMTALGDVRQLQIMERDKGRAIKKQIDPPLTGPNSLRSQKTSLLPGDITYLDVGQGQQGLKSIHEIHLDLGDFLRSQSAVEYRIQRAFYEDLFLMLQRSDDSRGAQPLTAREVDERHEEKYLALGPVVERTGDELLDPIVDRVYKLMEKANLIPPAPRALLGVNLKVEYISILSQAQKLLGVVGQDRFLTSVAGIAATNPEARHKLDAFQAIDNYGDMLGVDPRIIRPTADAQAMAKAEADAQQAAASSDQALKVAQAAKAASASPLTGDSVLSSLASQAAPGAAAAGSVAPSQVVPGVH